MVLVALPGVILSTGLYPGEIESQQRYSYMRFPPWLSLEGMDIQQEDQILYTTDNIKNKLVIPILINGRGCLQIPWLIDTYYCPVFMPGVNLLLSVLWYRTKVPTLPCRCMYVVSFFIKISYASQALCIITLKYPCIKSSLEHFLIFSLTHIRKLLARLLRVAI